VLGPENALKEEAALKPLTIWIKVATAAHALRRRGIVLLKQ
jgi:hypothetical protein